MLCCLVGRTYNKFCQMRRIEKSSISTDQMVYKQILRRSGCYHEERAHGVRYDKKSVKYAFFIIAELVFLC